MTSDPDRLRQAEQAADAARALAHRREAARQAGVAWSGLAPDLFRGRSAETRAREIAARLAALQHWRLSSPGRLLAAMTDAERAVERVRACVARGLAASDARCGLALGDLERAAAAARLAMGAPMDAHAPGALSDGSCATSSASSSRSTPSSTNSAS